MDGKLLTIDEVAGFLGVHRDTVYGLVRSGRLPAMQLGGRKTGWRISEADLQSFIAEGKSHTAQRTGTTRAIESFDERQRQELATFQELQRQRREEFLAQMNRRNRV